MKKQSENILYREVEIDKNDQNVFSKRNRDSDSQGHPAFMVGKYIQAPPILFTADGHNVWLGDIYRGSCAFLIGKGSSAKELQLESLKDIGVVTVGLNIPIHCDSPNICIFVDDPTKDKAADVKTVNNIWMNPNCTKLVPMYFSENMFDDKTVSLYNKRVADTPNTFFYRRNNVLNNHQFLFEDSVNYGMGKSSGDYKNVMFAAFRLLYYIGIRNVFLVGCDFNYSSGEHNFVSDVSEIKKYRAYYDRVNHAFLSLKPHFMQNQFYVWNCSEKSKITAFPKLSYEKALIMAKSKII